MTTTLMRITLLTLGAGAVEIGIVPALATGSLVDWALVFIIGVPLLIAGSAGFMGPLLLGGHTRKEEKRRA